MTRAGGAVAAICSLCGAAMLARGDSGGARALVITAAMGELGNSDGRRYFDGVTAKNPGPKLPAWCGVFALWALHRAGLLSGVQWIYGKGFLFRLPRTLNPEPGDLAYFTRLQHHAIVKGLDGPNVTTIDGNHGGKVELVTRPISTVAAFYSIKGAL